MQFSTKEDIEAPIDEVFEMLSDFEMFERAAVRRGTDVQRASAVTAPGLGMGWLTQFEMRGKPRDMNIAVSRYDRPGLMAFDLDSAGLTGLFSIELIALSPRRTRGQVTLTLAAHTLPARLLLQSLRLGRATLAKQFRLKVAEYAKVLEDRHKRIA